MLRKKFYLLIAIGAEMLAANELPGDLRITGPLIGVTLMAVFIATYNRE